MKDSIDPTHLLGIAIEEAREGLAEGGIPIGAALFDGEGNLLGRGHNRRIQEDDPSIHGETDAFRKAGRQRSYRDTIMATTLAPVLVLQRPRPPIRHRHRHRRRIRDLPGRHRLAPRKRHRRHRSQQRRMQGPPRPLHRRASGSLEGGYWGIVMCFAAIGRIVSSLFLLSVVGVLCHTGLGQRMNVSGRAEGAYWIINPKPWFTRLVVISPGNRQLAKNEHDPSLPTLTGYYRGKANSVARTRYPFESVTVRGETASFKTKTVAGSYFVFRGRWGTEYDKEANIEDVPYIKGILLTYRKGKLVKRERVKFSHEVDA